MNDKHKIKCVIITDDYKYVVTRQYTKLKNNPFYGVKLTEFNYVLKPEYIMFDDPKRAQQVINHFYLKELAEQNNCKFKVYSLNKWN